MSRNYFTLKDGDNYSSDYVMEHLEEIVAQDIDTWVDLTRMNLIESIRGCESPIEQLMVLALTMDLEAFYLRKKLVLADLDVVGIHTQSEVDTGNKKYRVDIEIPVYCISKGYGICFVVECDGHDFHEKTKEQAKRDKERERDLVKTGRVVLRFSGSEIYNDSAACSREVFDVIFSQFLKGGE